MRQNEQFERRRTHVHSPNSLIYRVCKLCISLPARITTRDAAPVPQTTTDIVNLPSAHDISHDENPSVAESQHNFVTDGEIRLPCLPGHLQLAKQFSSDICLWFVCFYHGVSIASRVLRDIDREETVARRLLSACSNDLGRRKKGDQVYSRGESFGLAGCASAIYALCGDPTPD